MKMIKIWKYASPVITFLLIILVLVPFTLKNLSADDGSLSNLQYDPLSSGSYLSDWGQRASERLDMFSRCSKYRLFNVSPSNSIWIGKEGWLYYTPDYNLEIPTGKFPMPEDLIASHVENLKVVKTYYDSMGIDFYYLPYPSQTSVYPECIGRDDVDYSLPTPVDILEERLRAETDINIVSTKRALIDGKSLGQVFRKTDVHTSDLGTYITYQQLCKAISEGGEYNIEPVTVTFVDGDYLVGANEAAKVGNLFGSAETAPVAVYESAVVSVNSGKLFDAIGAIYADPAYAGLTSKYYTIFENPSVESGTVLIYGYSTFLNDNLGETFQLLRLIAENFHRVVFASTNSHIISGLDTLVDPDIVILESPERFLYLPLLNNLRSFLPTLVDVAVLESIPVDVSRNHDQDTLSCLDIVGETVYEYYPEVIPIDVSKAYISIAGWVVDKNFEAPLSNLYIRIGNYVINANYGIDRTPAFCEMLGYSDEARYSGYHVNVPGSFFKGASAIELIGISTDGTRQYQPITYRIQTY